jgi:glycosyltransferase involved in cell wall biosynthesis
LKVLYLGHTAKLSGGEIALSRLIPALSDRVHPLLVLAEDGPLVGRMQSLGIDTRVVPLPDGVRNLRKDGLSNLLTMLGAVLDVVRYVFRLRRLIRAEGIDLVHTNTLKAGFYGCLAARLARVPSIWHLRDRLSSDYLPPLAVLVTRLAISLLPSRVVCNSKATMATLPSGPSSLRRRRAYVVHSPIRDVLDVDGLERRTMDAERADFRVGMVGRLSSWKGQDVVVRAFAEADLALPSRLVIIGSAMFGEDDYERTLREEIERSGLRDRVEMRGFVEDVFGALQEFDVLVHASIVPEPFGQVIVEGLAAGLPVVATREGGPSEIVTDGVDGLLYDAGDVAALARLLRRLQEDRSLRARLRENGLRRSRDFSSAAIAPQVLTLYESLVPERRG